MRFGNQNTRVVCDEVWRDGLQGGVGARRGVGEEVVAARLICTLYRRREVRLYTDGGRAGAVVEVHEGCRGNRRDRAVRAHQNNSSDAWEASAWRPSRGRAVAQTFVPSSASKGLHCGRNDADDDPATRPLHALVLLCAPAVLVFVAPYIAYACAAATVSSHARQKSPIYCVAIRPS
jgi:hypothetical protein